MGSIDLSGLASGTADAAQAVQQKQAEDEIEDAQEAQQRAIDEQERQLQQRRRRERRQERREAARDGDESALRRRGANRTGATGGQGDLLVPFIGLGLTDGGTASQ